MKRPPVLLTDVADRDVEEQASYMAGSQDAITGARFVDAVYETIELLARYPRIGRVLEGMTSRMVREMRILQIKGFTKHLVLYRITKRGVEILRIVHGARDFERLFED